MNTKPTNSTLLKLKNSSIRSIEIHSQCPTRITGHNSSQLLGATGTKSSNSLNGYTAEKFPSQSPTGNYHSSHRNSVRAAASRAGLSKLTKYIAGQLVTTFVKRTK